MMHYRVFYTLFVALVFTACVREPETNEFSHIREQMEKRQSYTFSDSIAKLEERNRNYHAGNGGSKVVDPDEQEQRKLQEERQKWRAVHIDDEEAEDWKALGLSPKNAVRWKKTGLSYNTIAVLIREDVLPSEAIAFMRKEFRTNPKAFHTFSQPLFDFKQSCEKILSENIAQLKGINTECREYIRQIELSMTAGYLADEYKDSDLALEYVSSLRQIDARKPQIQKQMNQAQQVAMIQGNSRVFVLLFPILENSPSKEEMFYVKQNGLPLTQTKRYKSYEYYEFWVNKDKKEKEARLAAIEQQKALEKAKVARKKAEAYRMKALAHNKMVASECGDIVTSAPSTGEQVHIEGRIEYFVGKRGSNIFAYVVRNNKDGKKYLVRDPEGKEASEINEEISWTVLTVGRVASVSLDDDGTASYNHYTQEIEGQEYFPMLKFVSECGYHTKPLRK